MHKIIFSVLLIIFSSNVFAFELWQGLEFDANSRQIMKKFPSAKIDSSPRFLAFGFDKKLIMNNYMVFDNDFDVIFLMKNDNLKKVQIETKPKYPNIMWSKAFNALSLKYGEPYENYYKTYGLPSAYWSHNGVRVTLLNNSGKIHIVYDAELADNSSKL